MSDEIRLELDEQQEDICFELDGPPVPGKTGNGIASIVMNPDYTLTINYTDGTSYTTIIQWCVNGWRNATDRINTGFVGC